MISCSDNTLVAYTNLIGGYAWLNCPDAEVQRALSNICKSELDKSHTYHSDVEIIDKPLIDGRKLSAHIKFDEDAVDETGRRGVVALVGVITREALIFDGLSKDEWKCLLDVRSKIIESSMDSAMSHYAFIGALYHATCIPSKLDDGKRVDKSAHNIKNEYENGDKRLFDSNMLYASLSISILSLAISIINMLGIF